MADGKGELKWSGGQQKAPPKRKESEEEEVSPAEDLMREHGLLNRILLIYEEVRRRLTAKQASATTGMGACGSSAFFFRSQVRSSRSLKSVSLAMCSPDRSTLAETTGLGKKEVAAVFSALYLGLAVGSFGTGLLRSLVPLGTVYRFTAIPAAIAALLALAALRRRS